MYLTTKEIINVISQLLNGNGFLLRPMPSAPLRKIKYAVIVLYILLCIR